MEFELKKGIMFWIEEFRAGVAQDLKPGDRVSVDWSTLLVVSVKQLVLDIHFLYGESHKITGHFGRMESNCRDQCFRTHVMIHDAL